MSNDKPNLLQLQETFQRLYRDELPLFIHSLNETENLPDELKTSLKTIEENIEENRILLAPILNYTSLDMGAGATAGTGITGTAINGIFGKLVKKQAIKMFSGKRLVAIQASVSLFENTIQRMEQLLDKTEDGTSHNYENLAPSEKQELLFLAERMEHFSKELTEKLAA